MAAKKRISVTVRPQSPTGERLIELGTGTEGVGCLVSIRVDDTGGLVIEAYRADRVRLQVPGPAGSWSIVKVPS